MRKRDLTLNDSPKNYIPEMKKTRPELLKNASESVDKLQRLLKRYEDQINKTKPREEPGLVKADDGEDPDILEDMVVGGKKPAVDLSLGSGSPVPTTKAPVKPLVVTPGSEKAFSPEARRAALEARRRKKKPKEEKKPVGLPEYLRERRRKAVRVGFVSSVPDDVGRSE